MGVALLNPSYGTGDAGKASGGGHMAGHSAQVLSGLGWQRRPLMTCAGGAFAGRAASAGSAVVGAGVGAAVVGTAGLRGGLPAAGTAGAAARDGCGTADREPGGEFDG